MRPSSSLALEDFYSAMIQVHVLFSTRSPSAVFMINSSQTGVISGAMLLMKTQFNLTVLEQSSIVSVTIIGAWMFSLISGWLSDRLGRKMTILISSIVFTIGSLLMAVAYSSTFLVIGRFILGIAIGFR